MLHIKTLVTGWSGQRTGKANLDLFGLCGGGGPNAQNGGYSRRKHCKAQVMSTHIHSQKSSDKRIEHVVVPVFFSTPEPFHGHQAYSGHLTANALFCFAGALVR
jgi:hypothetical protein